MSARTDPKGRPTPSAASGRAPKRPAAAARHSRRVRTVTFLLVVAVFATIAIGVTVIATTH